MDLGEFYHFRCFTEKINLERLIEFLKTETDVLVIVMEISKLGKRPHIHSTLRFKKAINTFRDKLRKEFPDLFGNKSYSISKVRDYDSNLKYCLKGVPNDYPDVLYSTLSKEEIIQYYNEYWNTHQSIVNTKKSNLKTDSYDSEEEVKVKIKIQSWSQKVTKHIIEEYSGLCQGLIQYYRDGIDDTYEFCRDKLIEIILEKLGQTSKNLDEFILIRLYNAQVNAIIQQVGDSVSKTKFSKCMSDKIKLKIV